MDKHSETSRHSALICFRDTEYVCQRPGRVSEIPRVLFQPRLDELRCTIRHPVESGLFLDKLMRG